MKVDVKFVKGGKVKKIDERLAKALVAMGRVEYYDGPEVTKKQTYNTKVLKADIDNGEQVKKKPGRPKKVVEAAPVDDQSVAEVKPVDVKPVTDNTYETKVLTAEE